ncbi:MAG: universal stress protein, partial [Bradymonadaceae bacterium]
LEYAADFARAADARLTIPYAVPVMADLQATPTPEAAALPDPDAVHSRASEQLDAFLADAPLEDLDWEGRLEMGSPAEVIQGAVDERDADLVVMGTHGRRGLERLFLGSTATKVLRRMPCSVMTVRSREDADD